MAEEPGLDWLVVLRLEELKSIEQDLLLHGDDYKQLPNIRAITEAYRMGELEFSSTLVTYWSNGERISEPGKFRLKHFLSVNKRYNGHEGFWVEGVC